MRTHLLRVGLALALALGLGAPAVAQSTGMVKGKVVDAKGEPVEGAKILIEFTEGVNRKNETKTNKKGEFIQIGLFPGAYRVTASKEKVGQQSFEVRVRIGTASDVNFQLSPESGLTDADKQKTAALQAAFQGGIDAARGGQHEAAIAKFTEAAGMMPACHDCYYNIGFSYTQLQKYAEAEAAFKKAIELKPDSAAAYNGLATIYNAQKKFDEAAAASAKAAELAGGAAGAAGGGGNAEAIYNQGVILWNGGKYAEAKAQFEKAISLKPDMADAHYQLAMANLNLGQTDAAVAAFEGYLKVAPTGPHAEEAKNAIAALKK
jgi:tetratricopeptide (TPR) repeat protein